MLWVSYNGVDLTTGPRVMRFECFDSLSNVRDQLLNGLAVVFMRKRAMFCSSIKLFQSGQCFE